MSRFTKILLALTIINLVAALFFLTDIIDVRRIPGLYATFPIGVTGLGMFLISLALEKEVAAFDAEQSEKAKTNKVIPWHTSDSPDGPDRHQAHLDHAA